MAKAKQQRLPGTARDKATIIESIEEAASKFLELHEEFLNAKQKKTRAHDADSPVEDRAGA